MTEQLLAPMVPTFFRFPDEAAGMAAIDTAGLLTEDGDFITASHTHALDVIGLIYRGGEWNPETGEVITPPTLLDGWHVNYQGELPDGWEEFAVFPQHPARVWASAGASANSVRARNEDGTFKADDPATPSIDEAWTVA